VKIHNLFEDGKSFIPVTGDPLQAPATETLQPTAENIRRGQQELKKLSIDAIIGIMDAFARDLMRVDHPLANVTREMGTGYIPLWMRRANLEKLCDLSVNGNRKSLDQFEILGNIESRKFRAQPRGTVVHWIAGNVPVLGMLSLLQGLLTKNANIIKAPSENAGLLPAMLESLSRFEWKTSAGVGVSGKILTDAVAVIYVDREDIEAERALSAIADVRIAWGNRTAVEAIMNLPRRFGTEDIIFGPKISFAVVGTEHLSSEDDASKVAHNLARDVIAFDQQGCNSPHNVFVERGSSVTPVGFARIFGDALGAAANRRPLREVTPADTIRILSVRAEYDIRGEAYYGKDIGWTVAYNEDESNLADPCYLRTVFVRPVDDIFDIPPLCSVNTQTAGLSVGERGMKLAEALTAQGVERCPAIGNMSLYDAPWDGMFPIERLVRWTSLG
jgi:hypothetical protein